MNTPLTTWVDIEGPYDKLDMKERNFLYTKNMIFCHAYLYIIKNNLECFKKTIDSLHINKIDVKELRDITGFSIFDLCEKYNKIDFLEYLFKHESDILRESIAEVEITQPTQISRKRNRM